MLDTFLVHLFHEGNCLEAYRIFGARKTNQNSIRFSVYAPNAKNVYVIGEWNDWDTTSHKMKKVHESGIYTLEISGIPPTMLYKYHIETQRGSFVTRADPYAITSELRPGGASRIYALPNYQWKDTQWLQKRTKNFDKKMNIYEMHIGSWKFKQEGTSEKDGVFYTYEEMISVLLPYIKEMGYTHIELMPLLEHPFDGSWGYQATGFFSITSRYGTPEQFMKFVDACHQAGIGVILDFVPTHFVKDSHGLYQFDGGCVYEYPNEAWRYSEWDSVYFDVGNPQVRSFLMSSIDFLLTTYHIDGIRFDAISHFIYRKGRKEQGLNDAGISFLQHMNALLYNKYPTVMLIAEDSSDFPKVTKHPSVGGLGFDYKWDLGWMNDTLRYMQLDPLFRKDNHHLMTFSMAYFYQENFILPFSHDEVVHSKKTIVDKIWGNQTQQMAQYKTLYTYMFLHPGKKLNFMGNELAEYREWDESKSVGWEILTYPRHDSFQQYVKKLHQIYQQYPCMYEQDYYLEGFNWLVVDDANQSVFALQRSASDGSTMIAIFNFTPNRHDGYRIPVSRPGSYQELLNSDTAKYAGSNICNVDPILTQRESNEHYIPVVIAPFAAIVLVKK